MKMPATPPDPFSHLPSDRFMRILDIVRHPTIANRYLHWDKLRNLPLPEALGRFSHQEWWAGLKFSRRSLYRSLPLTGADGRPFLYAVVDATQKFLHYLDSRAGGVVLTPDDGINPSMRDRYVIRSLTEEAITSSQLEGAATTREVAKQMLRSGRPPRDTSEQMILNNYRAMQQIRAMKNQPLTTDAILNLHRTLATDTLDKPGAAGRWRLPDEYIRVEDQHGEVLHTPPPANELPARMEALCAFANDQSPANFIHPVIRAIVLHFWLAYDHPFVDGNGRCARALFYWSMLNSGYWLCEFISISEIVRKAPIKYGRAFLYTETDDNDVTYFVLYHLEVLQKAIEALHAYIDRKTRETREVENFIQLRTDFNHRQLALLGHALRHPDAVYTISEHQRSHGVVHQTARTDLLDLVSHGLLLSSRRGREYYFRPAPDLQKRLRPKGEGL